VRPCLACQARRLRDLTRLFLRITVRPSAVYTSTPVEGETADSSPTEEEAPTYQETLQGSFPILPQDSHLRQGHITRQHDRAGTLRLHYDKDVLGQTTNRDAVLRNNGRVLFQTEGEATTPPLTVKESNPGRSGRGEQLKHSEPQVTPPGLRTPASNSSTAVQVTTPGRSGPGEQLKPERPQVTIPRPSRWGNHRQ